MVIKVLGKGCKKCQLLEKNVNKALEHLGISARVIKVTDNNTITNYGVMQTPALVVDEQVKLAGRVASYKKIASLIQ